MADTPEIHSIDCTDNWQGGKGCVCMYSVLRAQLEALREALGQINDRHNMQWEPYRRKYGLPFNGTDSPSCDEICAAALGAHRQTAPDGGGRDERFQ